MRTAIVALVCATAIMGSVVLGARVEGASTTSGHFQVVPQANTGNVWVLNTRTGQVRLCLPPSQEDGRTPECLGWGD